MKLKFLLIMLFCLIMSCHFNNKTNQYKDQNSNGLNLFFEDIDFSTFKGIIPVNIKNRKNYLQINHDINDKIIVKFYYEINSEINFEGEEVFLKKEKYYYQHNTFVEEHGLGGVEIYKFFHPNYILIYNLNFNFGDNKSKIWHDYEIIKINFKKMTKQKLIFSGSIDHVDPNIDFKSLKQSHNNMSFSKSTFKVDKKYMVINDYNEDYQNDIEKSDFIFTAECFPSERINVFWNIYMSIYGESLNDRE